ncbi:hypothetical protein L579_3178 [Pantoea sp. AS-PWVM4]|nr:hypothetical protein L579_3178 [Pantoea sp. AS-PWVM4]
MKCSETGMNGIALLASTHCVSARERLLHQVMMCNQMRLRPRMGCKLIKFCHA